MSKVKIAGHASGSGTLTIQAPDTSSSRTITLPDATGTLLNSDGSAASLTAIPAANITGTLPAISGANLTGLVSTIAASTDATVSASDPTNTSNPTAVGHLWLNSSSGEGYICTSATTNENVGLI